MEPLAEIWIRATQRQPLPAPEYVVLAGVFALALVLAPVTWPWIRLGVTVVHEAGHALVAVLVGRRLAGIRLHSDTSGVTVSKGRARGPGMVAMLAAGYLAPAVLGVLAAWLLAQGRAVALLWLLLLLLAGLLVWVRNGYGFLVLLGAGAGVLVLTRYAPAVVQSAAAYVVAWLLLLSAPRPLVELLRGPRSRSSDPGQLARLTRVPAVLWTLVLLVANLAGLVLGLATLAPELLARA